MRWNTAYASSTSSQLQPADTTTVSGSGDDNAEQTVQKTSDAGTLASELSDQETGGLSSETSDSNADEQLGDVSSQNTNEQTGGTSEQNTSEQVEDTSDENTDGQTGDASDQNTNEQTGDTSDQDTSGQTEDTSDQNTDEQSNDELTDEGQDGVEDDDEWADGDDEWTDAWTGVDDDIADGEWADDLDQSDKVGIVSADSKEAYDGQKKYNALSIASNISSDKNHQNGLDQNYQTGAGLGSDIFLLLAAACGIAAIGLTVRKSMRKD